MHIPQDAQIPPGKFTDYLLVFRPRSDKSGFLAQAGFVRRNPHELEAALRRLLGEFEATPDRQNEYGTFYRVAGHLSGPEGELDVVTIWLRQASDGVFRFVTLKPMR